MIEQRLAADPNNAPLLENKAEALYLSGEKAEAEKTYRLLLEIRRGVSANLMLLAEGPDSVIDALVLRFTPASEIAPIAPRPAQNEQMAGVLRASLLTAAWLRLDPVFDPLRSHPRFIARLARAEADPRKSPRAKAAVTSPPAGSAGATPDPKSVAVLPFTNLSAEKDNEYFSDGLTEEILNSLARERDLRVPGRASAFSFKGRNASSAEIARALNVAQLVEGSVRRSGNKVRISVHLWRAADGFSDALPQVEREMTATTDIFALQDEVARAVVEKLTQRRTTVASSVPTRNMEAYDAYLRGRALQAQSAGNAGEAARLFERAVALDPGFAVAWAQLASARSRPFGTNSDRSPALIAAARSAVERALASQPSLPEALIIRAEMLRVVDYDYAGAQRDLAQAESIQPASGELRNGQARLACDVGNWADVFRFSREALALDPQNGDFTYGHAIALYRPRGDFAETDRLIARAIPIQPEEVFPSASRIALRAVWRGPEAALRLLERGPTDRVRDVIRADLFAKLGRMDEARAFFDAAERNPGGVRLGLSLLTALGRTEAARRRAEEMRARAGQEFERGNRAPAVRADFVRAEIALGHHDSALQALEDWRRDTQRVPSLYRRMVEFNRRVISLYACLGKADETIALLREFQANGYHTEQSLRHDFDFAPIRNDPRF